MVMHMTRGDEEICSDREGRKKKKQLTNEGREESDVENESNRERKKK